MKKGYKNKSGRQDKGYEKPTLTKYKKISEWVRSGTTSPITPAPAPVGG